MNPSEVTLDLYEMSVFNDLISKGLEPENVLRILINTVEGDFSQLSNGLKDYAIANKLL